MTANPFSEGFSNEASFVPMKVCIVDRGQNEFSGSTADLRVDARLEDYTSDKLSRDSYSEESSNSEVKSWFSVRDEESGNQTENEF
jgi:hypothetical protein